MSKSEVIVIGAGAVGVACALWLQRKGRDVVLLERDGVASGASFGNASTIADYACTPVPQPAIWSSLPGLLFSHDSPLVIRWSQLPRLAPWLAGFLAQCNGRRFLANAQALADVLRHAHAGYAPLLADNAAAAAMLHRRGCLYSYGTRAALVGASSDIAVRRELGVAQQVLSEREVVALEPTMAGRTAGGVLFPTACHLADPQAFVQALAAPLIADGRYQRASVGALRGSSDGMIVTLLDGTTRRADRVVLAGGAWSGMLARQVGDSIPLGAERGYHIEFDLGRDMFNRPTCLVDKGFYMTPLRDRRLRAAGTIELSGLRFPLNRKRTAYIERHIRAALQLDAPVSRQWLGMRPTVPDYLPVIGPSAREPRLIYAFGHQHLGMTLAGVTGEAVAACIDGRAPAWMLPFTSKRF